MPNADNTNSLDDELASLKERHTRWQEYAISQLTVSLAFISSIAFAGLGAGFHLFTSDKFNPTCLLKNLFASSMFLFALTLFFVCLAVVSRTIDFRLTREKIKNEKENKKAKKTGKYKEEGYTPCEIRPTMFGLCKEKYGEITWFSFKWACFFLLLASVLFGSVMLVAFFNT
jgi:hypothetical protein